jgi:D-alanine--poly(phosphoribitol) ligase subunit 1
MLNKIRESIIKYPNRNSFCIKNRYYTYNELGIEMNKVFNSFYHIPCDANCKYIGVIINEDFQSYASCLSVLLAGFGYVPINPLNPIERNLEILKMTNTKIVLSTTNYFNSKQLADSNIKCINTSKLPNEESPFPDVCVDYDRPAYILFTSGSTGRPKGTPISRENIETFIDSACSLGWNITEEDKFLQMSSMTFDMSIITFILPLLFGACIYTVPEDEIKYLFGYELMKEKGITFIAVVPSTIAYLKPYFKEIYLPTIRYSLICGEALPVELAEQWANCVTNAEIINIYGPTEATVFTHTYNYSPERNKNYNGILAIGHLVKNMQAIILDDDNNILGADLKGELCLAGKQLTNGYLNDENSNSISFFELSDDNGTSRYYRTGDIVKRDAENCYYYIGRKDFQVKIQGHRVELGEIEKHVRDFTKSDRVAAITKKNRFDNYHIHLFVERMSLKDDSNSLLSYLKTKLPYYMMPHKIEVVNSIPLNQNGKIDRNALLMTIKTNE